MFIYLVLIAVDKLKAQRSTASIHNIFRGRKSAQTIQDAHIYQLKDFYGIYRLLKREDFERILIELVNDNLLTIDESENAYLTHKGKAYIDDHKGIYPVDSFKGMDNTHKINVFIERFLLTLQTFTNISMKHNQFQPVVETPDVQRWVKRFYQQNRDVRSWLVEAHDHIEQFLVSIDQTQAAIFVARLTGYKHFGLTIQQLALKFKVSIHDVYLLLMVSYHQLLSFIEGDGISCLLPLLPGDECDRVNKSITLSAEKTYRMIKQGLSIEQLMQRRRLKRSTIEDHIVELAYAMPNFKISPYINEIECSTIINKLKHMDDHRLSIIKNALDDRFSYFQIRLALARTNVDQ